MSLQTFESFALTAATDGQCPALDKGQILRTASLCILVLLALGLSVRYSDATQDAPRGHALHRAAHVR